MISEQKYLKQVYMSSDVYAACLQHCLTTEKEEVMGLLIGRIDENKCVSHISACVILHRSDKQPDRVEISPEQLCIASGYADELAKKLNEPLRVIGWYHSHPHITVWPSHVDVRTQMMYQMMDPLFVGIIFSVYQGDSSHHGNHIQVTCFQATKVGTEFQRREVGLSIENSEIHSYNLQSIASLPRILSQEEGQAPQLEGENIQQQLLTWLHNDAFQTLALVHIVSKVSKPLCEGLEDRLNSINLRIKELEDIKRKLENK